MSPANSKDNPKKQSYRPSKESKVKTQPQKLKSIKIKNPEECIENHGVEYESNNESQENKPSRITSETSNEAIRTSDVQEIGTNSHQTTGERMNVIHPIHSYPATLNLIHNSTNRGLSIDGLRLNYYDMRIETLESMVRNLVHLHMEKRNINDALRDIFTRDEIITLQSKELIEQFKREYSAFL